MIVEKRTIRTTRTVTETEKRTIRRTSKIYLTDNQPSPPLPEPSPDSGTQTGCEESSETSVKVFSNTPAEGELQRGDVIISIGDRNGDELTHKQAKDLIERGGGQISLVLTRGGHPPTQPPPGRHDAKGQSQAPTFRTPAPVAPRTNPPKAMPYHGGGAPSSGHKPKKLNISKLGGGGPDFGSDFSRPHTTMAPQQSSAGSYRPVGQQQGQMLNRVQESLDNIIYSPRTPEGYQAPPFQPNMYQPAQPPPFQPNMSMSGFTPQQQAPMQQSGYRPTFEAVDSGQYSEEQEEFVPVWERRKTFQDQRPTTFKPSRSTPVPKVPRPVAHHPDAPSFGTDYSKGQAATMKWTPQRAAPPPQPSKPVQSEPPLYPVEAETMAPWRNTLRSTGVKPWDVDLDYTSQQPTPRSGAYNPIAESKPMNQYNPPAPAAAPTYGGGAPSYGGQQGEEDSVGGPKVVHLQYNSPMGLYSQQNVKETLAGQTKAQLAQTQAPPPKPMKDGDRDWNASAVYRMIHQEERRPGQAPAPGQAPQAPRAAPPPPAPKPVSAPAYQPQPQFSSPGFEDELGVSDF